MHLERQLRVARRQLWLNRWLGDLAFSLAAGGGLLAAVVLAQRLFDWPIPLGPAAFVLLSISALVAVGMTLTRRESLSDAAAALDQAANLRERLSTGRHCLGSDDPFARAVVADAERVSQGISARSHLRIASPRSLPWTALALFACGGVWLISPGVLKSEERVRSDEQARAVEQTREAVARKLDEVKKLAEETPALEDLKDVAASLEPSASGTLQRPDVLRTEALKKIDNLADAVKQKRDDGKYDTPGEVRKMFRALKAPESKDAMTDQLVSSLTQGDFKAAREEIEKIKEQLATLKNEEDKQAVEQLSKQLDELAKQIEKLAGEEKLAAALQQAGIKPEDAERLLEQLGKLDLEQLAKELEKRGLDQKTAEKLAKQLQQKQGASGVGQKLAQALSQASKLGDKGQSGEAMAGLTQAADQLGALEQLQQESAQLESALSSLEHARDDLGKPCSDCNGSGKKDGAPCSRCGGSGQGGSKGSGDRPGSGMGKLGQGRGGIAEEQSTDVDFKIERGKVQTDRGAIIGQFKVDGEQVKGEVSRDVAEVVTAGEREASDRINRDRIPRQYHGAIKSYFSNLKRAADGDGAGKQPPAEGDEPEKNDER